MASPVIYTDPAKATDALAGLLARSRRMVGFTGAGISTECGVPDFRSPGSPWMINKPIPFAAFTASALKEKLEGFREEIKGLEATVSTAPAGPPAQRLAEIQQQLTTLPAEAEAKQKAAEAAWQEYLNLLPQ